MAKVLRPRQERAIEMLRDSIRGGHRRPVLQGPVGFGKTLIACEMIKGAVRKGNKVNFAVPFLSLIDQTVERFWDEDLRCVGVIQADHPLTDPEQLVQVCSIQTLASRDVVPDAELNVIDECHRDYEFVRQWMANSKRTFIGLSATPWARGMGQRYDDLVIPATMRELIDEGWLVPIRAFAPSQPDLSGVKTVAGDYHEGQLSEVMRNDRLVADVVETWMKRAYNEPTFLFAVDRAHARKLQAQFQAAGVQTGYIDAFTKSDDRKKIFEMFRRGYIKIICSVGALTTGVDEDVRCIILARPTKSEILYVQMIGRGMRIADGKQELKLLDHSNTTMTLGFADEIHHIELDDGKPKKKSDSKGGEEKEKLPKPCPACAYLKPAGVHKCPACGFAPQRQSEIACEDGELVELQRAKKRNRTFDPQDKRRFYGELKWIARYNRYKEGWAANKYRSHFGCWPNAYRDAPEREPSPETWNWVKNQQIRYAKGRAKAEGRAA